MGNWCVWVFHRNMSSPQSSPQSQSSPQAVTYPDSSSLKVDDTHLEDAASSIGGPRKHGDAALEILGENIIRDISPEEDRRVLRKIDLWIMPVVLLVYFLQQLDKYVLIQACIIIHIPT